MKLLLSLLAVSLDILFAQAPPSIVNPNGGGGGSTTLGGAVSGPGTSNTIAGGQNGIVKSTSGGAATTTAVTADIVSALGLTSGQTSNQVLGTCGTSTAYAPCSLTATDIPQLPTSQIIGFASAVSAIASSPIISILNSAITPAAICDGTIRYGGDDTAALANALSISGAVLIPPNVTCVIHDLELASGTYISGIKGKSFIKVGGFQGTLTANIASSGCVISVSNTTITNPFLFLVDSEYIYVTGIAGGVVSSCIRSYNSTTAATHANGTAWTGTTGNIFTANGTAGAHKSNFLIDGISFVNNFPIIPVKGAFAFTGAYADNVTIQNSSSVEVGLAGSHSQGLTYTQVTQPSINLNWTIYNNKMYSSQLSYGFCSYFGYLSGGTIFGNSCTGFGQGLQHWGGDSAGPVTGTITADITDAVSCNITTSGAYSSGSILHIDTEFILETAGSGNSITGCTRGYVPNFNLSPSTAATHTSGTTYYQTNPSTNDGDLTNIRWTQFIKEQGNDVSSGGGCIWGSMGQDISVVGNTVENCTDEGIAFEGTNRGTAIGNTCVNVANACYNTFNFGQKIVFSGNSGYQPMAGGVFYRSYNVTQTAYEGTSIVLVGNMFTCGATSGAPCVIDNASGPLARYAVLDNVLVDTVINFTANNTGEVTVKGNTSRFDRAFTGTGIYCRSYASYACDIMNNTITSTVNQASGVWGIIAENVDTNANNKFSIYNNTFRNFISGIKLMTSANNTGVTSNFFLDNNNLNTGLFSTSFTGTQKSYVVDFGNNLPNPPVITLTTGTPTTPTLGTGSRNATGFFTSTTAGAIAFNIAFANYEAGIQYQGWNCSFADWTTPTNLISQTATTTASGTAASTATASGTTANGDVIHYSCSPY